MIVKLNLEKATRDGLIVDRSKFFDEFDNNSQTYKMLKGTPLLISVEGSYVNVNNLPNLVVNKHQGFIVNQWVSNITKGTPPDFITFVWRRTKY